MNEYPIFPAFEKALARQFGKDENALAGYLFMLMLESQYRSQNMVWDWLAATGDKNYTTETFYKIARELIARQEAE